VHHPVTSVIPM